MGLITKYLKNSEEDEELYFQHLDMQLKMVLNLILKISLLYS